MQASVPAMTPEQLAAQLRCPQGADAVEVGERMQLANGALIRRSIALLGLQPGDHVLEIGPGNGAHVPDLLLSALDIRYTGLDLSHAMVEAACSGNAGTMQTGQTVFVQGSSESLPFAAGTFDHVLCINTLYFWQPPQAHLHNLHGVLKPGGSICLAFGDRSFMDKLPFTPHGFLLYDRQQAEALLHETGFIPMDAHVHDETAIGNHGDHVEKTFHILHAQRA